MAIAETLTPEAEQAVIDIIRQDLINGHGDEIIFDPIEIFPREDRYGYPYYHIYIIHSGDGDRLNTRWLNGLKLRNHEQLAQLGVHIIVESYVERAEAEEVGIISPSNNHQGGQQ